MSNKIIGYAISSGMYHFKYENLFAEISAVVNIPANALNMLMPMSQGIAHQYSAYCSPCGNIARIGFPTKKNGNATIVLKAIDAAAALNTRGLVFCFAAASFAVKGKIVNATVAKKKLAISENRVAI